MKNFVKFGIILWLMKMGIAYAQSTNFFAVFINNSKSNAIHVQKNSDSWWDNFGWGTCNANWSLDTVVNPNSVGVKCGGTTSRAVDGYLKYNIIKDSKVLRSDGWWVTATTPAHLAITTPTDYIVFKPQRDHDSKDILIVYVFDDNGFSTTVLTPPIGWNFDTLKKISLSNLKCDDPDYPNGCSYYQKY